MFVHLDCHKQLESLCVRVMLEPALVLVVLNYLRVQVFHTIETFIHLLHK